jgi:uncharacterized protein DUF3179
MTQADPPLVSGEDRTRHFTQTTFCLGLNMKKNLLIFIFLYCLPIILSAQEGELFDNFQQLLLRGQIPAIFEPKYVTADEADIDDDSWVFGIVIEGQPRAYSLNILNHHEIVNDRVGESNFAVVW